MEFGKRVVAVKPLVDVQAVYRVSTQVNRGAAGFELQKRLCRQETPAADSLTPDDTLKQTAAAARVEAGKG